MLATISLLPRLGVLGVVLVIGAKVKPDSTRQNYGYGGLLPVPVIADDTEIAIATLPDLLVHRHSLGHVETGRVLYATTHAQAARGESARIVAPAARTRRPCSQVVQAHSTNNGSPIS